MTKLTDTIKKVMTETLTIIILVIVALTLVFQIELYRNILHILTYYTPEAAPPKVLRQSDSFLDNDEQYVNSKIKRVKNKEFI